MCRDYPSPINTNSLSSYNPEPTGTQSATDASMGSGLSSSTSASALSLLAPRSCGSLNSDQATTYMPSGSKGTPSNSKGSPSNSGDSCSSTHHVDAAESVQPQHEVQRPDSTAELDTLSSSPHDQVAEYEPHSALDCHMTEAPACLTEAVGRHLQEFMLTHDSSECTSDLQVCSLPSPPLLTPHCLVCAGPACHCHASGAPASHTLCCLTHWLAASAMKTCIERMLPVMPRLFTLAADAFLLMPHVLIGGVMAI